MVILDNVDVSKLDINSFRKFDCPCELCDCGCFQRMKYTHNSSCKKQKLQQYASRDKVMAHSSLGCPLTHYRDTFKSNPNHRPPTAFIPPSVPLEKYIPQVPMDMNTVQKLEYKGSQNPERTKAIRTLEIYKPPKEPLNAKTQYQIDYPVNNNPLKASIVKKHANAQTMILSHDKVSDKTTTNEHYRAWSQENPVRAFTEWPSYAGESLFPTAERNFSTTTATFHPPILNVPPAKSIIRIENKGSLGAFGVMDMNTTNRDTYIKYENPERTKIFDPMKNAENNINHNHSLVPMQSSTQNRSDFVLYRNFQPTQPANVNPYLSDLDRQIYPSNLHDLTTSYSKEYKGYDIRKNPKAQLCKKENEEYKPPTEKIDGMTVTMRDFKPIDVSQIPKLKIIKGTPQLKTVDQPMESQTTTSRHFIKYDVKPIHLASDPYPSYYIPSKEKFNTKTTNEDNYYAKVAEKISTIRPENNISERHGKIDLNSVYRNEFVDHGLTMCEAKAFLLADAFKKKQDAPQTERLPTASSAKKKAPRIPSSTSTQFTNKLVTQIS